jgi:Family of unknown function (DUF6077)
MTAVEEARTERPRPVRDPEPPAGRAADRFAAVVARASDRTLDFLVVGFAAWTAIYHVCLVLRLGVVWAAAAMLVVLLPCTWLVMRGDHGDGWDGTVAGGNDRRRAIALVFLLAGGGAALFAFTGAPWFVAWLLLAGGAAAGVVVTRRGAARAERPAAAWPGALVALAWAAGLAVLSLFLVRADGDDTHYIHLASWIAAHGELPLRDVLFTDQELPAIFYPPLSSYEALAGTLARGTGIAVPNVVYYAVPPVGSALAVLATWRLLRDWGVRMVGVALSAAMLFLLWDAGDHKTLGSLFVGRMWQGKILFLAVLVPTLFVLLNRYAARPTRRALVMLAAAGAAGVGLTITGVVVVPVVAAGCLAPLALKAPRQAAAGFAATAAYPIGAAAVSVLAGARNAQEYVAEDVIPDRLLHLVFEDGALAFIALGAMLAGPVLIRRVRAAESAAATSLLVICLFAPAVSQLIFHVTGLGQVQWRLTWAVPIAALVGVAATSLRLVPAALLVAALLAWGTPVWTATEPGILPEPAWKRWPDSVTAAHRILRVARSGDHILAPAPISETLLVVSGEVTAVAPRAFYASALLDVPGGHGLDRLILFAFSKHGLDTVVGEAPWIDELPSRTPRPAVIARALRAVDVDLACMRRRQAKAVQLLRDLGYSPVTSGRGFTCLRAPG